MHSHGPKGDCVEKWNVFYSKLTNSRSFHFSKRVLFNFLFRWNVKRLNVHSKCIILPCIVTSDIFSNVCKVFYGLYVFRIAPKFHWKIKAHKSRGSARISNWNALKEVECMVTHSQKTIHYKFLSTEKTKEEW